MKDKTVIFLKNINSPLGKLVIGTTEEGCCLIEFEVRSGLQQILTQKKNRYNATIKWANHPYHENIEKQLVQYFSGSLKKFDIKLDIDPDASSFQRQVWDYLLNIEYGNTVTYKQIARSIGNPNAVRAVGSANGANNIAIVIPCHRVITSSGLLGGYSGGVKRKKKLIEHERINTSTLQNLENWF